MMGSMKRFLALGVVAITLAACAEQGTVANPRATVLSAIANVYEANTVHMEFEMGVTGGPEGFEFSGTQDVELSSGRGHGTMNLGMLGGTVEMVTDGEVFYMSSGAFGGGIDTEWISFDMSRIDSGMGGPFGGLSGGQSDPAAFIGLFGGVVDVRATGEERIDGVQTTRYEGTIDVAKVIEGLGEVAGDDIDPASVRRMTKQLDAFGLETVAFQVWVDDNQLLRKERLEMDLSSVPGAPENAAMTIEARFSDYGEPVDIEIPKPSEVTDVTEQLGGAGSGPG